MRPLYGLSQYGALEGEIIGMRSSSGVKQIFTFYKKHRQWKREWGAEL